MNIIKKILLGLIVASQAFAVSVYTLDEQISSANMTVLRFKIENNTNDTLNGIELHYHVVQDSDKIANPEIYYMPSGQANWVIQDSVTATLVVYFPNVILYPGDTLGGISGYSLGLHNTDWSTWTKSNDPSQPAKSSFALANNVDVISGGKTLMLNGDKYANCPVVQFIEVQKDTVALQVLQQLATDSAKISIVGNNGKIASVNLNESTLDSMGQKIWRGYAVIQDSTNRGEFWAECNGNMLAYFAYGWTPTNAQTAVTKSLWKSAKSYVQGDFDMGFNQGLSDGQRLVLNTNSLGKYVDARSVNNWKFYRAWEEPGENPMPTILSQTIARYDADDDIDSLTFEWSPIEGIEYYNFIVMSDSIYGDTLVSIFTSKTSVRVPVFEAGNYVWFADPLIEAADSDEDAFTIITSDDESSNSPMVLRKSRFKRFKRWAKKTVKKAAEFVAPVTYAVFTGNRNWDYIKQSFIDHVSPFGVVQIFVHSGTLHTQTITITKKLDYLGPIYAAYHYSAYPVTHQCFTSDYFCAMKDTRMLDVSWDSDIDSSTWDHVLLRDRSNAKSRCWLTMAQMLNHYYNGNISEDEIMYYVRGGFGDHEGGGPIETIQAVNYALGLSVWDAATFTVLSQSYLSGVVSFSNLFSRSPSLDGWSAGTPLPAEIIIAIESGKPMGVSQLNANNDGSHSMVINGYRIKSNGNMDIHLMNTDNSGGSEWRYYCNLSFLGLDVLANLLYQGVSHLIGAIGDYKMGDDMFFSYFIPPSYVPGRSFNMNIYNDTDGDSIVDIDETERFGSLKNSIDSDGDGVEDKKEIEDFKECEVKLGYYMPVVLYNGTDTTIITTPQYSFTPQSDFDGDSLSVVLDMDSDGDGYCDAQEMGYDNSNGFTHICERFDANKYPSNQGPLCRNYNVALLASDKIQLNDRAYCVDQNGAYCPVASYDYTSSGTYGVELGVSAKIGPVYSGKSVLMRSNAFVNGLLETGETLVKQSSTAQVTGTVVKNYGLKENMRQHYERVMNQDTELDGIDNITDVSEVVVNAQVERGIIGLGLLGDKKVIVNSQGQLNLYEGRYILNSLQLNSGALVKMPETGNVVIYVINDFQWRGHFTTMNYEYVAKRLKIYVLGTGNMHIETNFAGQLVAPDGDVIIGQAGKHYYGAVYAKSTSFTRILNSLGFPMWNRLRVPPLLG